MVETSSIGRRTFLVGTAAAGLATLPGCSTIGGFSFVDAIRRLLEISTQNAFARLTAPGGFWDSQVARLALPSVLGGRGKVVENILASTLFRDRLQRAFNDVAIDGARRAAPMVAETVRMIGIQNAIDLVRGGPSDATAFLRHNMAGSLINAMVPALGDGLRVASDPLVGQLVAGLTGVDVGSIAQGFSRDVDDAIWREIGFEEANIRRNPQATRDPLLIGVFGLAGAGR